MRLSLKCLQLDSYSRGKALEFNASYICAWKFRKWLQSPWKVLDYCYAKRMHWNPVYWVFWGPREWSFL